MKILKQRQEKGIEAKVDGNTIKLVLGSDVQDVVFGKQSGKYAVMSETTDGHILVVGGAGSGKTFSIAIPTLMSWKERVFAIVQKASFEIKDGAVRDGIIKKICR